MDDTASLTEVRRYQQPSADAGEDAFILQSTKLVYRRHASKVAQLNICFYMTIIIQIIYKSTNVNVTIKARKHPSKQMHCSRNRALN